MYTIATKHSLKLLEKNYDKEKSFSALLPSSPINERMQNCSLSESIHLYKLCTMKLEEIVPKYSKHITLDIKFEGYFSFIF